MSAGRLAERLILLFMVPCWEEALAAVEQTFYILLDYISDLGGTNKADVFLQMAKTLYGLSHVSYLGVNIPISTYGSYHVQCTYSNSWVQRYVDRDYVSIDPVVRQGFKAVVPLDWADLRNLSPEQRRFFGESQEFGVGRQGLLFPIRGINKDVAIFCINSDMPDHEWRAHKQRFMRDFQTLGAFFHNHLLSAAESKDGRSSEILSAREVECLKWATEGKSAWETSVILGISERCVRFHLDQARCKLNCLTKVQTVAKAVASGLVHLS